MKLLIYTIPGCPWCISAKAYLDDKKVKYTEKDVSSGREEVMKVSGQESVPVIVFTYSDGSEKVLADFDNPQIDAFLKE